jgi:OOP family OmpA-OmpF porin
MLKFFGAGHWFGQSAMRVCRLGLAGFVLLALILGSTGCSTGSAVERWQLFESASSGAKSQDVAVELLFFRELPSGRQLDRPINVYIDGHYQASLVGNAFTRAQLCPGEHRLAVAVNDVERRYLTKEEGLPFKVEPGGPRYFRVADTQSGVVTLTAVAEAEVPTAVQSLATRQSHAVPRLPRTDCSVRR